MTDEREDPSHIVAEDAPLAESAPADEEQSPEGEAQAADPEGEGSPATDDAGAPRSKGVERRIGQLTRRFREEQRQNQELKAELERIKQRLGPPPELIRPKPSDFDTTEDYEDALLTWHDARKAPPPAAPAAKPKDPAAEKLTKGIEALADPELLDTIYSDDWPCNEVMYEFLVNSDHGPELTIALASDPDLAEKIASLSPVLAARELVKLEAGLPASKPSVSPGAPPPPPPVTPVRPGSTRMEMDPDKMPVDKWLEWRNKQLEKRA